MRTACDLKEMGTRISRNPGVTSTPIYGVLNQVLLGHLMDQTVPGQFNVLDVGDGVIPRDFVHPG